jgi:hypothetical protein
MMRSKLYVETSVISYLTARPSRDVVSLGHQQLTRDWCERAAAEFDLYASGLGRRLPVVYRVLKLRHCSPISRWLASG